jgi:hypothetical protein
MRVHALRAAALVDAYEGAYRPALRRSREAAALAARVGDEGSLVAAHVYIAEYLHRLGSDEDALQALHEVTARVISRRSPELLVWFAEMCAVVWLSSHRPVEGAARLVGAAEEMRKRHHIPLEPMDVTTIEASIVQARSDGGIEWSSGEAAGRREPLEVVLGDTVGDARRPGGGLASSRPGKTV